MILDIERERGWLPGTFDRCEHEDQVRMIAHWRVRHEAATPASASTVKPAKGRVVKSPRG